MNKWLTRIEEWFTSILLLVITILLFLNVVLRIFGFSLDWAEEFSRYSIIWITFIGGSMCFYRGAHIGIDSITVLLSDRGKKYLALSTKIISIIFLAILFYVSFNLVSVVLQTGQQSATLGVPMWVVYSALPVGSLLMIIRLMQDIYSDFFKKKEG